MSGQDYIRQDQRYIPCPGRPSHFWAYSEGIFFRIDPTPRHLCLPGNLTSLLSAVQSKKAPLALNLSEGGVAGNFFSCIHPLQRTALRKGFVNTLNNT